MQGNAVYQFVCASSLLEDHVLTQLSGLQESYVVEAKCNINTDKY